MLAEEESQHLCKFMTGSQTLGQVFFTHASLGLPVEVLADSNQSGCKALESELNQCFEGICRFTGAIVAVGIAFLLS